MSPSICPRCGRPQVAKLLAAMDVVLTWDTNGSQHMAMPRLRKALGLPGEPPTREEAQARLNAYHGIESGS